MRGDEREGVWCMSSPKHGPELFLGTGASKPFEHERVDHNGMGCRVYSGVAAGLILSCMNYADLWGSSDLIKAPCHINCGTSP